MAFKRFYRLILPRWLREWIYGIRHPDIPLEKKYFQITRNGIRSYLEWVAKQNVLRGIVLEIGSGRETYNHDIFVQHSPEVIFLRSEISHAPYGYTAGSRHNRYSLLCDVTALGFRDGSLDGLICSEVLEHVPDYPAAIREITRVLKPGGKLILTSPFLYPLHGLDFWRFTPQALELLLREHFRILDVSLTPLRFGTETFPVNIGVLAERK
jgi:SAM-dependent methyltransferase